MIDLDAIRKSAPTMNRTGLVLAALTLCDEVEALRAQVPEVLREWPAKAEDAPGEWFLCQHVGWAPRGTFETRDGYERPVFVDDSRLCAWVFGEFEPGEFFVRAPE